MARSTTKRSKRAAPAAPAIDLDDPRFWHTEELLERGAALIKQIDEACDAVASGKSCDEEVAFVNRLWSVATGRKDLDTQYLIEMWKLLELFASQATGDEESLKIHACALAAKVSAMDSRFAPTERAAAEAIRGWKQRDYDKWDAALSFAKTFGLGRGISNGDSLKTICYRRRQ